MFATKKLNLENVKDRIKDINKYKLEIESLSKRLENEKSILQKAEKSDQELFKRFNEGFTNKVNELTEKLENQPSSEEKFVCELDSFINGSFPKLENNSKLCNIKKELTNTVKIFSSTPNRKLAEHIKLLKVRIDENKKKFDNEFDKKKNQELQKLIETQNINIEKTEKEIKNKINALEEFSNTLNKDIETHKSELLKSLIQVDEKIKTLSKELNSWKKDVTAKINTIKDEINKVKVPGDNSTYSEKDLNFLLKNAPEELNSILTSTDKINIAYKEDRLKEKVKKVENKVSIIASLELKSKTIEDGLKNLSEPKAKEAKTILDSIDNAITFDIEGVRRYTEKFNESKDKITEKIKDLELDLNKKNLGITEIGIETIAKNSKKYQLFDQSLTDIISASTELQDSYKVIFEHMEKIKSKIKIEIEIKIEKNFKKREDIVKNTIIPELKKTFEETKKIDYRIISSDENNTSLRTLARLSTDIGEMNYFINNLDFGEEANIYNEIKGEVNREINNIDEEIQDEIVKIGKVQTSRAIAAEAAKIAADKIKVAEEAEKVAKAKAEEEAVKAKAKAKDAEAAEAAAQDICEAQVAEQLFVNQLNAALETKETAIEFLRKEKGSGENKYMENIITQLEEVDYDSTIKTTIENLSKLCFYQRKISQCESQESPASQAPEGHQVKDKDLESSALKAPESHQNRTNLNKKSFYEERAMKATTACIKSAGELLLKKGLRHKKIAIGLLAVAATALVIGIGAGIIAATGGAGVIPILAISSAIAFKVGAGAGLGSLGVISFGSIIGSTTRFFKAKKLKDEGEKQINTPEAVDAADNNAAARKISDSLK